LLVTYQGARVMIDCGEDWRGRIDRISPHAIAVTHAHPDHASGLRDGAPCPVYATRDAWGAMSDFAIVERKTIGPRPVEVGAIRLAAFPVVHSIRAPAVGYRIHAGEVAIFYVPDVIDIVQRVRALAGVHLYIGDGSSLTRPLVRRSGSQLFGHTTVRAQLGWCQDAGISRAIFTHCGSEIVEGVDAAIEAAVSDLGRKRAVDAQIAHDGMEIVLR
jgi:phosphoribosyl 1,2-cyclic phosphodiesterase